MNFLQPVIHFLLCQKCLEIDKLNLVMNVFGESSFRYNHVFLKISLLELDDLPVVRSIFFVHVAELIAHFTIDPK